MKFVRLSLILAGALVIACPLVGAEKEKPRDRKGPEGIRGAGMEWLSKLNLSEEQKAKVKEIQGQYAGKMKDLARKLDGVLTEEQRKARQEAMKAAAAGGKKGPEVVKAAQEAVKLSGEQKAKMEELRKEMGAMGRELREKVMSILSAEQKEQAKKLFQERSRGQGETKQRKP